jgi:predicted HicB family RNase H-like nuclease
VPHQRPYVPEEEERVQLQFRLSASLRERLRKEAQRRNVSANLLIERALEEGLTKWEKEKKP